MSLRGIEKKIVRIRERSGEHDDLRRINDGVVVKRNRHDSRVLLKRRKRAWITVSREIRNVFRVQVRVSETRTRAAPEAPAREIGFRAAEISTTAGSRLVVVIEND